MTGGFGVHEPNPAKPHVPHSLIHENPQPGIAEIPASDGVQEVMTLLEDSSLRHPMGTGQFFVNSDFGRVLTPWVSRNSCTGWGLRK